MKTLFIGYYGYNNYGDDLMLMVLDSFCNSDCTVLTKKPLKEKLNLRSKEIIFKNFHFDFIKALLKHERVLWGGGTCFYSNGRNLIMLLIVTLITRLLNKEIVFFSVGIGKIEGYLDRLICKFIYNLSTQIFLRDEFSLSIVNRETKSSKGVLVEDLFFLKNRIIAKENKTSDNVNNRKIIFNLSSECIGSISIREVMSTIDALESIHNINIEFVSLQNDENSPEFLFYKDTGLDSDRRFRAYNNNLDLYKAISECSMFIGFRLHGLLTAVVNSIPVLAYPYSPKVDFMLENTCSESYKVKIEMGTFPSIDKILNSFSNNDHYHNCNQALLEDTEKFINEILV